MDEKERNQIRDHAWKYFLLHADQRIKTFNFFLILCALISGALTTILKDANDIKVGIPLALLLTFLSFIFWKIDLRNKQLISHGENALKCLEDLYEVIDESNAPNLLKVFNCEEQKTKRLKQNSFYFTYSTCFHLVFLVFGIAGIVVAGWLLR